MVMGPMEELLAQFDKRPRHIMRRDEMQSIAIPAIYYATMGIADPNGICQYVGKHRLWITGWAANKLENFSGRTLLFGYCAQFAGEPLDLSFAPQGTRYAPTPDC
jgi:hypothetical protein